MAARPLRHGRTAAALVAVVFAMVGLAFASVPLYRLFCSATGFDGTTQRADAAPGAAANGRTITVRFNADKDPSLPWRFEPMQHDVTVRLGEPQLVTFRATNLGKTPLTGTATYNVTPLTTGLYFDKIECFCFTQQTLQPGETAELPVTFFVNPEIENDPNTRNISTITLSYTFFPAKNPAPKSQASINVPTTRTP
ncbi:MAG TPA: cytochrome c oxidase assembly protein [Stellaceae bacterium]|nr:cytochrome c oxidase assembly protein [Stellaceae bacterium]